NGCACDAPPRTGRCAPRPTTAAVVVLGRLPLSKQRSNQRAGGFPGTSEKECTMYDYCTITTGIRIGMVELLSPPEAFFRTVYKPAVSACITGERSHEDLPAQICSCIIF